MSTQHAQQYIAAELYDYNAPVWSTPESQYANRYLTTREVPTGRFHDPKSISAERKQEIRDRIDRELAR